MTLITQIFCYAIPYFFFNDTPTTEIYTLSLHDALPISKSSNLSETAEVPACNVPSRSPLPARSEERFSRNAETDLVCRLLLEKKNAYTNESKYRDVAEDTLEAFAGIVEHYGLFAATLGIALDLYLNPHTQIVIVGDAKDAGPLVDVASAQFSLNKAVVRVRSGEAV